MDDLVTRLHDAKPPHHRKCLQAADEIERLRAELARVRKLGEAMAMKLDHMGTWIVKHANPGRELKYNTSPARAALAAWFAEAGR